MIPLIAMGSMCTAVINAEYLDSSWRYSATKNVIGGKARKPSNKIAMS